MELHAFSDASIKAYGAVVYLYSQTHSDTAFVIAKSRIAPLKCPTLPRLELMAALIAARLTKFVINSLNLINIPVYVWVDIARSLCIGYTALRDYHSLSLIELLKLIAYCLQ